MSLKSYMVPHVILMVFVTERETRDPQIFCAFLRTAGNFRHGTRRVVNLIIKT